VKLLMIALAVLLTGMVCYAEESKPLLMELSTSKEVYSARDNIFIKASLWATKPVTLCLYPTHPEANFSLDINRAGFGKVNMNPSVVQLKREDLKDIDHVKLEAGQRHLVTFNLKQLAPMPPSFWKTGEYQIQVKFFLCGATEQAEQEIPSQGPLHLLIAE